jgi:MtrB/PioB family decaheme-associated outer membrane protein
MKHSYRLPYILTAAGAIALSSPAHAEEQQQTAQAEDPYAPLLLETRPLATRWQTEYNGVVQLGLDYTSDDSFKFGQYNGRSEKGTELIGNLRWQDFGGDSYWRVSISDLGLDTREGEVTWGRGDRLKLQLGFDSQIQVRNDSGRTPLRGNSLLSLPDNWESGRNTSDFSTLTTSLLAVDQELQRDKLSLGLEYQLHDNWRLDTSLSYEDKEGTSVVSGAIYSDAATGDAVHLPAPVDFSTTEFDLGLAYSGNKLHLQGRLDYSKFDNDEDLLSWQNPYSGFGGRVRYPQGYGGLGTAPDNEQTRGRISGQYIITSTARFQFDGSYAVLEQDQDYLDYTVNPTLDSSEPLPRDNFDGSVDTGTLNLALLLRPIPKLNVKGYYAVRDRDYDAPRDGYRYNRGDAGDQPRQALTVYNTAHDYLSQTIGMDLDYRLPLRSKLSLDYAYENIERRNAAVEETKEDRYTLTYRIQPWTSFTAKLAAMYGNRNAGTYNWDQRYYALLDVNLINATPDNQRFINHPQLSQYHLSNRDRSELKADFTWQPANRWNLNLNLLWREDDYDKTELGLTDSEWQRLHLSASYAATDAITASIYGGYDAIESSQTGRSFRGGQEKNAFAIYPPLPQGSDPSRNWDLDAEDDSATLGANLNWKLSESWELAADYNFVDTTSSQALNSIGLDVEDLPDVETRLHHATASGTWHMSEAVSLRLDYQYYRYKSDDFIYNGSMTSIDRVLTLGESNPNEQIHYVGASAFYRW